MDEYLAVGLYLLMILDINVVFYIIGGFTPGLKNSSNRIIAPFFITIIIFAMYMDFK